MARLVLLEITLQTSSIIPAFLHIIGEIQVPVSKKPLRSIATNLHKSEAQRETHKKDIIRSRAGGSETECHTMMNEGRELVCGVYVRVSVSVSVRVCVYVCQGGNSEPFCSWRCATVERCLISTQFPHSINRSKQHDNGHL